jgi:hypothetical protein
MAKRLKHRVLEPLKLVRRSLKAALYYGFKYHCPICGSHTRVMKPFGLDFPVLALIIVPVKTL